MTTDDVVKVLTVLLSWPVVFLVVFGIIVRLVRGHTMDALKLFHDVLGRTTKVKAFEIELEMVTTKVEQQQATVANQQQQLEYQQKVINELVTYSMAYYIYTHLKEIYLRSRNGGEYLFRKNDAFERDLYFLREHGFIEMIQIRDLADGQNLVGVIKLTPVGHFYVELREGIRSPNSP